MLASHLIASTLVTLVAGALLAAVMWALSRWTRPWVSVSLGVAAFAYVGQGILRGLINCSGDGVWIAPTASEQAAGSVGAMHFPCDGAGGLVDRFHIYILGPLTLLFVGWQVYLQSQKFRRG